MLKNMIKIITVANIAQNLKFVLDEKMLSHNNNKTRKIEKMIRKVK